MSESRWAQIGLLVLVNAFVGGMVGLERTLLPLLARDEFGIAAASAAGSFIVTFGLSKAIVNLFAGHLADRFGRKRILVAGWLAALPIPIIILFAPSWSWIVAANALLGVNQGLAWSMTVNMKLDRARADERGLVVGLNEAAGYLGVGIVAFATGFLAVERASFLVGFAIAGAGLLLSFFAREAPHGRTERASLATALRDRRLAAPSFAGLATNAKDGALWALLPIALAARGFDLATIGSVVAAYPIAWGIGQVFFGPLSDRIGRRELAIGGLVVQALGVAGLAWGPSIGATLAAATLVGVGTAMAYPTLLALVADLAAPHARATSLGVYRFWRDAGYAAGALGAGLVADALGGSSAFWGVALVVALAALGLAFSGRPRLASA